MPERQPHAALRSRTVAIRAVAAALVAIAAVVVAFILMSPPGGSRASLIGGPFALQDGNGRTVGDQTLKGRPYLVYFGYTHCPDVCPADLAKISDILDKMGKKPIPVLFITVDPERDTPKVMADYVSSFSSAIVGLSGTPQAVEAAEKAFRVYSRKGKVEPDGGYSMDHSSVVYLMDKNGAFAEAFNVERPPADAAKELEKYL